MLRFSLVLLLVYFAALSLLFKFIIKIMIENQRALNSKLVPLKRFDNKLAKVALDPRHGCRGLPRGGTTFFLGIAAGIERYGSLLSKYSAELGTEGFPKGNQSVFPLWV